MYEVAAVRVSITFLDVWGRPSSQQYLKGGIILAYNIKNCYHFDIFKRTFAADIASVEVANMCSNPSKATKHITPIGCLSTGILCI
jgi:hypothetical protein